MAGFPLVEENDGWASDILFIRYGPPPGERASEIKPDVAHVQNVFPLLSPAVYWTLRRFKIPIVQVVHNYRFMCANGLFLTPDQEICERCKGGNFGTIRLGCYRDSRILSIPMAATLMLHRFIGTFTKCINRFVVSTEFVKIKLIQAGFPGQRITLIRNPSPPAPSGRSQRSTQPLFVYCGRHSREKGLWTLLRAFHADDLGQLKILGQGPLTDQIRLPAAHRLKNIEILGRVSNDAPLNSLIKRG